MKIRTRTVENQSTQSPVITIIKCLVAAYLITMIMLLILAFILYKFGLNEKTASIAIIIIYAAVTFIAGFLVGKLQHSRKFAWGLLTGMAYFIILFVVSMIFTESPGQLPDQFATTFLLCAGGGMLGGMLS